MMYPKPKLRKKSAKNNPMPTADDRCIVHNTPFAETHEVFPGKHRQKSIRYGLQIKVCRDCHRYLTLNPQSDWAKALRKEYQQKFVDQYGWGMWMKEFGRNYLDERTEKETE